MKDGVGRACGVDGTGAAAVCDKKPSREAIISKRSRAESCGWNWGACGLRSTSTLVLVINESLVLLVLAGSIDMAGREKEESYSSTWVSPPF